MSYLATANRPGTPQHVMPRVVRPITAAVRWLTSPWSREMPVAIHQVVQAEPHQPTQPLPSGRLGAFLARTRMRMKATAGWLPVWLAVATVLGMYLFSDPFISISVEAAPLAYVLFGLTSGLVLWMFGAAITNSDALPARANERSYNDLVGRLLEAHATIECRVAAGRMAPDAGPVDVLKSLNRQLADSSPDLDWASGIGYVDAWRMLHCIEEDLIEVAPHEELEGILYHDEMRIEGSKLNREGTLSRNLMETARKRLDAKTDAGVRSVLRVIRESVNDFRDQRFETLIRNRMHVDRVSLLLGLAAWAVLCLGILAGADRAVITSVSALYLVGAATGLFTQLRSPLTESHEDVFGFGQAQLRQTVVLSGLAGVAGVFFAAVVGGAAVAQPGVKPMDVTIAGAFTLSAISVVTAAAFGLAPGMLTDRLSGWAKANIEDLESTTAAATAKSSLDVVRSGSV